MHQEAPLSARARDTHVRAGQMVLGKPPVKASPSALVSGSSSTPRAPPKSTPQSRGGAPTKVAAVRSQVPRASASSRRSHGLGSSGDLCRTGLARSVAVDDECDDDEEDAFRALRRAAKVDRPTEKPVRTTSQRDTGGASGSGLNVHPSYFNYEAGYRALHSARAEAQAAAKEQNAGGGEDAVMVEFLQLHGLQGPLRAYARAFALQGIEDPTGLLEIEDAKLAFVLKRVQMDCGDELALCSVLRDLRR
eukprot:gnl/TRDRNA2_/TRDRNA2_193317_c0_seq1.p1 gnl/TRDRNA2_/TRDRNA2_193317_c0~~gnl/TRDRNA2_/TRDRNA2_193317_c0_seq1.p1  ORF type:complete len:249 (+),score=48.55 gnl/TRDRNA2_/TRDRNA2_193317_c0_seq1:137-883(+)